MVWGGTSHLGKTELIVIRNNLNAELYVDEVLRPVVISCVNAHNGRMIFQQDNAWPHTARYHPVPSCKRQRDGLAVNVTRPIAHRTHLGRAG